MLASMANRTRLILDLPEDVRLAVRLAATRAEQGISEFVVNILRRELAAEIKDAAKYVPKKPKSE